MIYFAVLVKTNADTCGKPFLTPAKLTLVSKVPCPKLNNHTSNADVANVTYFNVYYRYNFLKIHSAALKCFYSDIKVFF